MITSQFSYYAFKMNNLQTIKTSKKDKKWLSVRIKLSIDARMPKSCLEKLHGLCYLMIAHT